MGDEPMKRITEAELKAMPNDDLIALLRKGVRRHGEVMLYNEACRTMEEAAFRFEGAMKFFKVLQDLGIITLEREQR